MTVQLNSDVEKGKKTRKRLSNEEKNIFQLFEDPADTKERLSATSSNKIDISKRKSASAVENVTQTPEPGMTTNQTNGYYVSMV